MHRALNNQYRSATTTKGQAQIAKEYAENAIHKDGGMGVGATVTIEVKNDKYRTYQTYAGSNIHYSGMEYKAHAEQVALRQALLDIYHNNVIADICSVVVVTETDGLELACGHCLQVFHGACDLLGTDPDSVEYIAAQPAADGADSEFDYRHEYITSLFRDSYLGYNATED